MVEFSLTLYSLYEADLLNDITLTVYDGVKLAKIRAHRAVLSAASSWFRKQFEKVEKVGLANNKAL
jgi:hypothetical protein